MGNLKGYEKAFVIDRTINKLISDTPITPKTSEEWYKFARTVQTSAEVIVAKVKDQLPLLNGKRKELNEMPNATPPFYKIILTKKISLFNSNKTENVYREIIAPFVPLAGMSINNYTIELSTWSTKDNAFQCSLKSKNILNSKDYNETIKFYKNTGWTI